jgi:hypothetical protein
MRRQGLRKIELAEMKIGRATKNEGPAYFCFFLKFVGRTGANAPDQQFTRQQNNITQKISAALVTVAQPFIIHIDALRTVVVLPPEYKQRLWVLQIGTKLDLTNALVDFYHENRLQVGTRGYVSNV